MSQPNRFTGKAVTDEELLEFVQKAETLKQDFKIPFTRLSKLLGYSSDQSITQIARLDGRFRPSREKYERMLKLSNERQRIFAHRATSAPRTNGNGSPPLRPTAPTPPPKPNSAAGAEPAPAKPQSISARLHQRKLNLLHERTELTRLHTEAAPILRAGIEQTITRLDEVLAMFN